MPDARLTDAVRGALAEVGIELGGIEERSFPGELWAVALVPAESLLVAQSLAGSIERELNGVSPESALQYVVTFRPIPEAISELAAPSGRGRLSARNVDQLIQLLEARSRTSDALPSLQYVEDPRTSLASVAASRHQFVYGRRGVGKTALLLEAKRLAESQGHVAVWLNAHVLRDLDPATAFSVVMESVLRTLNKRGGSSGAEAFSHLGHAASELSDLRATNKTTASAISTRLSDLNGALRAILRPGMARLVVFIDDFYLMPRDSQPLFLDYLAGALRDCDGWLKIASIERLTRPFEPSTRTGLEFPHDASKIDLDVTLEDPHAAQQFLEAVLSNYTTTVGISQPASITNAEARGRLVLASGGVPRDYLNLFASSIVVARGSRVLAREVGKEDVAVAAGRSAKSKKRDLELDVSSETAPHLLWSLEELAAQVKKQGFTYFRVDISKTADAGYEAGYEVLGQLVDLRFAHLVLATLSDQHKSGIKYEVYVLDLSEFTDVRLKRGLNVLDLDDGEWTWRLTGKAGTMKRLTRTQLRDRLRLAPLLRVEALAPDGRAAQESVLFA